MREFMFENNWAALDCPFAEDTFIHDGVLYYTVVTILDQNPSSFMVDDEFSLC